MHKSNPSDDWRYDNLKCLQGRTFRYAKYKAPTSDWNHDHCNGCWATFAEFDGTDIFHDGYVSAKPYEPAPEPEFIIQAKKQGMHCIPAPVVDGFTLHWVCAQCFEDFRSALRLKLEP